MIGAVAYIASDIASESSESSSGNESEVRSFFNSIDNAYVDYHWDEFYNDNFELIWRCRTDGGPNSGQFALDSKCALKAKIDTRWPDKSANH